MTSISKSKTRLTGAVLVTMLLAAALMGCAPQTSETDAHSVQTSAAQETDGAGTTAATELRPVTVILDYTINTNHSGLYIALDRGFFAEESLDVEIIEPAEGSTLQLLAAGQGEFGIGYQEDMTYAKTSDSPLPVKAIAAIIQNNTSGFASAAEKNIPQPSDWEGKTYASWGSPAEAAIIKAVMAADGADPDSINIINAMSVSFANLKDDVDLMWFFEGWDVIAAEQAGLELDYTPVRELDERLNYYTPIIVAAEDTLAEDPEMVKAFLRAATRGYEIASDPDQAEAIADMLLKYSPALDRELVVESQKFLAGEFSKGTERWGEMKDEIWDNYTAFMVDYELIDEMVAAKDLYTNEFLPE